MTAYDSVKSSANAAALSAAELHGVAEEFDMTHPTGDMVWRTLQSSVVMFVLAGADWLAIYYLLSLRYVDPMGNPTGDPAGLLALSGVTVTAFSLMAWFWGEKRVLYRVVAVVFYATVLTLLGTTFSVVEGAQIQQAWLAGGSVFGQGGSEAPAWFLVLALLALAVLFTSFGVALALAEVHWLNTIAEWADRAEARGILQRIAKMEAKRQRAERVAALVGQLESLDGCEAVIQAAVNQGEAAYDGVLEDQIKHLSEELLDAESPAARKTRVREHLERAKKLLSRNSN